MRSMIVRMKVESMQLSVRRAETDLSSEMKNGSRKRTFDEFKHVSMSLLCNIPFY